jgi:hypothetical protein
MIVIVILIVAASSLLAWAWIRGIDNMKDNHPEYKGDDFLDWGKNNPSWKDDEWDNNHHNEDV